MDHMRLKWREMFEECSTNAMLAFNLKFHQNCFEIQVNNYEIVVNFFSY